MTKFVLVPHSTWLVNISQVSSVGAWPVGKYWDWGVVAGSGAQIVWGTERLKDAAWARAQQLAQSLQEAAND